jgi:hypothetical protein
MGIDCGASALIAGASLLISPLAQLGVPWGQVIAITATAVDRASAGTPGYCGQTRASMVGDGANPDGNHKIPLRISLTLASKA